LLRGTGPGENDSGKAERTTVLNYEAFGGGEGTVLKKDPSWGKVSFDKREDNREESLFREPRGRDVSKR